MEMSLHLGQPIRSGEQNVQAASRLAPLSSASIGSVRGREVCKSRVVVYLRASTAFGTTGHGYRRRNKGTEETDHPF